MPDAAAATTPTHPAAAEAPFRELILGEIPRTLGLMDREVYSPTRGCLDRTYWAWKFTDFPGSRFQEGLCVLGYAFATPLAGSEVHQNERLLEWIGAGFDFWSRIQRRAGDFDEAYPLERSLAATAFTSFYLAEAFRFAGDALLKHRQDAFRKSLGKAAAWLCHNDEHHGFLSNHLAAAAAALVNAGQLLGEERFQRRADYFLARILDHQSPEGWYDEYGGADPGYQTHGTFYLARIHELTGDERLPDSIRRSIAFLQRFIHPDLSLGGLYASRNTQTYYPAAFEMLAANMPEAAWVAETMRPAVRSLRAAGQRSVDRYNYFPLLNNYVFAHRAAAARETQPETKPPEHPTGLTWFEGAGIGIVEQPRYRAYIGASKGGVIKVFDKQTRTLPFFDAGYLGRLVTGKLVSTQWIDDQRPIRTEDHAIEIEGRFHIIGKPVMKPWRFIAFRLFSLTTGHFPLIARWMKSILVKALIYRSKTLDLRFTRRIEFDADGVAVHDNIEGPDATRIAELRAGAWFATIHMGSSRYFVPHELAPPADAPPDPEELAATLRYERKLDRTRAFRFDDSERG